MDGWTRDLSGFQHKPRTVSHAALIRGLAMRASIELERVYPAPDEHDSDAITAIQAAGGIWGLPIIGDILDEPMQAWMNVLAVYSTVLASTTDEPYDELRVEKVLRGDFASYLQTMHQTLAELANGCVAGHTDVRPNWLAELHIQLVHFCGWSVAELVTHVMSQHRRQFPQCTRWDEDLIRHVLAHTPATPPHDLNA